MAPSSRFWDRIAKRYAKSPVADEEAYRKKLEITRGYFRPGMEVLEFGCGTGTTAVRHAPHVKYILATDISEKMLEFARERAREAGVSNVTFQQSSVEELKVPDRSLDAVMAHSILHLVENRDDIIARVFKMLRPGGVFISSTVCKDAFGIWRYVLPVGRLFGLFPLVRTFTAEELEDSMTRAGFEIDHRWQPNKKKALFIVARAPA